MSAKVKPIFSSGITRHIFLGLINPAGPFPSKILAHSFCYSDDPIVYIPKIEAYAMVRMDDECIIGHTTCSNCNGTIDPFDDYCSHCGAEIKGRKLLEDKLCANQ